ncbi:MAG: DNA-3-methyladenine glycosylase [Bacteroidia bacterium]|nr:DNA-3-methyladenine glycosylase [Bacteroidia bacterium]
MQIEIPTPSIFNFNHILKHLDRSPQELLHYVEEDRVWKWVKWKGESGLISFIHDGDHFQLNLHEYSSGLADLLPEYLSTWFDLDQDLDKFYQLVKEDGLLAPLSSSLYGLRVVGVHGLFEALSWAIIGQQVNLSFAYSMKKRLIENYGSSLLYRDKNYWSFPEPKAIMQAKIEDLMGLSISRRKAEYLIEVANQMEKGDLSIENLQKLGKAEEIEKKLCKIRGIGPWTANYVMLRCLRIPSAYPVGDAGLQNAVKQRLKMVRKPSSEELYSLAENWKGWEAYATFYLWNGLNKE